MNKTAFFDPVESTELQRVGVSYNAIWVAHTDGHLVIWSVARLGSLRAFRNHLYNSGRRVVSIAPAITIP